MASAKDAVANGATHLVIGRPVLQASDPAAALEGFMEEARCIGS
jgi:orotidine-5'-phosphate decarboxylase